MPYINDYSNPLDYALAPLKALGSPWGALQTAIAGGNPWEALADPDKAIRGRQFLEKMGWADQNSGAWADAAGMGLDIADPLSMLAFGGIGKGIQALRGIPAATEAAGVGSRALGHAIGFGLPMAGAALAGENDREGWHNPYIQGLSAAMEFAPLAHGGYNLARGVFGHGAGAAEVVPQAAAPRGEIPPMADTLARWRAEHLAKALDIDPSQWLGQTGQGGLDIDTMMSNMQQQHANVLKPFQPQQPYSPMANAGNTATTVYYPIETPEVGATLPHPTIPGMNADFADYVEAERAERMGPENARRSYNLQDTRPPGFDLTQQITRELLRSPLDVRGDTAPIPSPQDPVDRMRQLMTGEANTPPTPFDPLAATQWPRLPEQGPWRPEGGGLQGAAFTPEPWQVPATAQELAQYLAGVRNEPGIPPRLQTGPRQNEPLATGRVEKGAVPGETPPAVPHLASQQTPPAPVPQAVARVAQNKEAILDQARQHVEDIANGRGGLPAAMTARAREGMGISSHPEFMQRFVNLIANGNAQMLEKVNSLLEPAGGTMGKAIEAMLPATPGAKVETVPMTPAKGRKKAAKPTAHELATGVQAQPAQQLAESVQAMAPVATPAPPTPPTPVAPTLDQVAQQLGHTPDSLLRESLFDTAFLDKVRNLMHPEEAQRFGNLIANVNAQMLEKVNSLLEPAGGTMGKAIEAMLPATPGAKVETVPMTPYTGPASITTGTPENLAAKAAVGIPTPKQAAVPSAPSTAGPSVLDGLTPQQLTDAAKAMGFDSAKTLGYAVKQWEKIGYEQGLSKLRSKLPQVTGASPAALAKAVVAPAKGRKKAAKPTAHELATGVQAQPAQQLAESVQATAPVATPAPPTPPTPVAPTLDQVAQQLGHTPDSLLLAVRQAKQTGDTAFLDKVRNLMHPEEATPPALPSVPAQVTPVAGVPAGEETDEELRQWYRQLQATQHQGPGELISHLNQPQGGDLLALAEYALKHPQVAEPIESSVASHVMDHPLAGAEPPISANSFVPPSLEERVQMMLAKQGMTTPTRASDLPIRPPMPSGVTPPLPPEAQRIRKRALPGAAEFIPPGEPGGGPPPWGEKPSGFANASAQAIPGSRVVAQARGVRLGMSPAEVENMEKAEKLSAFPAIQRAASYVLAAEDRKAYWPDGIQPLEQAKALVASEHARSLAEGVNYEPSRALLKLNSAFERGTPENPRIPPETHPEIKASEDHPRVVRQSEAKARKALVNQAVALLHLDPKTGGFSPEMDAKLQAFIAEHPGIISLDPKPHLPQRIGRGNWAYVSEDLEAADRAQLREDQTVRGAMPPKGSKKIPLEDKIADLFASDDPQDRERAINTYINNVMQTQLSSAKTRKVGMQPGNQTVKALANLKRIVLNAQGADGRTLAQRLFPDKTPEEVALNIAKAIESGKGLEAVNESFIERVPNAYPVPSQQQQREPSALGPLNRSNIADVYGNNRRAGRTSGVPTRSPVPGDLPDTGNRIGENPDIGGRIAAGEQGEEPIRTEDVSSNEAVGHEPSPLENVIRKEQMERLYAGKMTTDEMQDFVNELQYEQTPASLKQEFETWNTDPKTGQLVRRSVKLLPDQAEVAYDRMTLEEKVSFAFQARQRALAEEIKLAAVTGGRYNEPSGVSGIPGMAQPAEISRFTIPPVQMPPTIGGMPGALQGRLGYQPQGISEEQAAQLAKALGISTQALFALLLGGGGMGLAQGLMQRQPQQYSAAG